MKDNESEAGKIKDEIAYWKPQIFCDARACVEKI